MNFYIKNTKRTILTALVVSLLTISCAAKEAAKPSIAAELEGTWKSEGYGFVISVQNGGLTAFDVTPKQCLKSTDEMQDLYTAFLSEHDVQHNDLGTSIVITSELDPFPYTFNRIDRVPDICDTPPTDSPIATFDSLAEVFREHYTFFDVYNVDWDSHIAGMRLKVKPDMEDLELYELLKEILAPIKDGHVMLAAQIGSPWYVHSPNRGKTFYALNNWADANQMDRSKAKALHRKQYWKSNIKKTILRRKGKTAGRGLIQYGMTTDKIGYLAITQEGDYARSGDVEDDLAIAKNILDKAITLFKNNEAKAVIIDLSINDGGYDLMSQEIASHFTDKPTFAYSKYGAEIPGAKPTQYTIKPSDGERFTGPVYVVTSDVTISAGEVLTLALRAFPNVTHVGSKTRGAFSDVLEKSLPKGWVILLSNQVFLDHEGKGWEGKGIEPEIFLEVFNEKEPMTGHLEAINDVIEIINNKYSD